ncbi:ABC transporter permease subunit [Actinoplanes sp. TBRC 11911]|uniref:ABC transporter permease n=1 Tax=Actinoplanes sp. TBRC 11911 TaxID=2729386 RepID=UPI00145DBEE8|nr:ABC transporter permease subunit [Actinoplanes sp. TBRC 11911]NMO49727.1 ABC transporter permease subunit [Actinoplanes sp. TBRC 11911]
MLVWTNRGRRTVVAVFAVVVLVLLVAPLLVVLVAAFSGTWNGVLPGSLTAAHLRDALAADNLASLSTSIQTAVLAGLVAVVTGTWAAIAADRLPGRLRTVADALFHLPVAVPSVVLGFGMLVAFSHRPFLLNGTRWIVIAAQTMLVFAFAYSAVSAAMRRLDRQLLDVAGSLGARPSRVLIRVTLPLLLPSITAAAALSVALCMGELGATVMVYPPSWRTLPVTVFGLSDRGDVFGASADTLLLLVATGVLLLLIGRIRQRVRT